MTDGRSGITHQASLSATPDVIHGYARAAAAVALAMATLGEHSPAERRTARMRAVVDAVWNHLAATGVSWVGFYVPGEVEGGRVVDLVLGPSRNKPACSPIGLHGVCGQAFLGETVRIVRDVAELGPNYVACDPRDRSELVLPVFDLEAPAARRPCLGVLDLDSHEVGRFTQADADSLAGLLASAGFAACPPSSRVAKS